MIEITKYVIRQTIVAIGISLSYFCIGLVRGYSSSAIPSINQLKPDFIPNKEIASWIGSVPPLGAVFGGVIAGPLMHKYGRRITVLVTSPLWILSWLLILLGFNWGTMLFGRFISGFCAGLSLPSAQIYVAECSSPHIRGIVGSIPAISMSLGILFSYVIGAFLPWHYLAAVNCVVSVVLFIAVYFIPESPIWLRTKKDIDVASKLEEWLGIEHTDTAPQQHKQFSKKIIFSRPILQPLGITLALLAIQQLSGIDAIVFFTVEIFRSAGSSLNPHIATIIVGLVQFVSNILSLFIVDKFGRKPLLVISGVVMALSMGSMGASFHLNSMGNNEFGFLPLVSLIVFMTGFSFGFGCIPFLLIGELFPTAQRSLLSSIAGSFNLGVMFLVIKTYHPLEHVITTAGTFWMYAVLCTIGVIFVLVFVPETKGKSLNEIANLFKKSTNMSDNQIKSGAVNLALDVTSETPNGDKVNISKI